MDLQNEADIFSIKKDGKIYFHELLGLYEEDFPLLLQG